MKKFLLASAILAAGIFAAIPSQGESALPGPPVVQYKCMYCGAVVKGKYDHKTGKVPAPSLEGCPKGPLGEHEWIVKVTRGR